MWRDVVKIHPAADLFPLLGKSELQELADDIKANGLHERVKVIYRPRQPDDGTEEQILIDGRNRLDAMELAGLPIFEDDNPDEGLRPDKLLFGVAETVDEYDYKNDRDGEIDPVAYVIGVNIRRRHLNVEQRQHLLIELIARAPEKSDRQIGKEIGVDGKTVAVARAKGEDVGRIPHVEKRVDTKGRKQPTSKAKSTTKPKPGPKVITAPPTVPAQPEHPGPDQPEQSSGTGFAERRFFGESVRRLVMLRGKSIAKLIDECSRHELRAAIDLLVDVDRAKQKAESSTTAPGMPDIPACLDRRPNAGPTASDARVREVEKKLNDRLKGVFG
jgi:hypothetical protein